MTGKLSREQLLHHAAAQFHVERDPKFPRVREKLLEGVVENSDDGQIFFATFDHLNPATPDRIFTGKARASAVVEGLRSEGVEGVSIILDNLSPDSERQLEGGGWGLGLGIIPDGLLRVLQDKDIFYSRNVCVTLDIAATLREAENILGKHFVQSGLDVSQREPRIQKMLERLGTTLGLYNFALQEGKRKHAQSSEAPVSASQILVELRTVMQEYLGLGTPLVKEVLQSQLTQNIAEALEQLASEGYPFWNMPGADEKSLVRQVDSRGKASGSVVHDAGAFAFLDGKGKETRRIREAEIFEALARGEVVPTAKLLMLSVMVAPEIPQFGNTYGLEQSALDWLQISGRGLRLNPDFQDSMSVGKVFLGDDKKVSGKFGLDLLHFSKERLREMIRQVAETGTSAFAIPFGEIEE